MIHWERYLLPPLPPLHTQLMLLGLHGGASIAHSTPLGWVWELWRALVGWPGRGATGAQQPQDAVLGPICVQVSGITGIIAGLQRKRLRGKQGEHSKRQCT